MAMIIFEKRTICILTQNLLLLMLLTLIASVSVAQKVIDDPSVDKKLFKPYEVYFHGDREWVYTHLNKSAYIHGDDVWFTSYVLNPANKQLNTSTSKLYVELWSPEKKLLSRKILFVKEGTTNHYIHLADSLAPGSYCFRAYTTWMRNFYSDNDLSSVITVLGQNKLPERQRAESKGSPEKGERKPGYTPSSVLRSPSSTASTFALRPGYDIQLLPESGTFLEGADNLLGIKATDSNGKGLKITGTAFTADNQEITDFSTNEYGMSSFTIPHTTNQQYTVKVNLPDGTKRDLQVPKAEAKGVIIQINPFRPDAVWLRIQTNDITRQLNKAYIVMVHANGLLFKNYRFRFSKENVMHFKIKKEEMKSGIIYATIFDENLTPLAERIFYNQDGSIKGNLSLKAEPLANDLVKVNVNITDSLTTPEFSKLSVSVLPGETRSNYFNNSLLSESILHPALHGMIENPNSYFEKNDFDHAVAINNLLLTQGWRKYDWPTILKDSIPKFTFPFEEAFTVEGTVKNWLKNKTDAKSKVSLFSPLNKLFLTAPVNNAGAFKFDRVYLADSTWVMTSAVSDKGKDWNRAVLMSIPEYSMGAPDIQPTIAVQNKEVKEVIENIPQLTKDVIQLPEMVVTAQKKTPFADNIYVGATDKVVEVTKDNYREFDNMEMLLMIKFNVHTEFKDAGDGSSGYSFNTGRGTVSFSAAPTPIMMLDGMKVYDAQTILDLPIEYVEAVSVNKDGFGGGMGASGGVISVVTRKVPFFVNTAQATNMKRLIVHGYASPRKYFEPKYLIQPGTADYNRYAAIFWKPDLITDVKNTASFNFYVPKEINTLTIRAEGISFDGKIFLHEQKMVIPGRNL